LFLLTAYTIVLAGC